MMMESVGMWACWGVSHAELVGTGVRGVQVEDVLELNEEYLARFR
jgi:hypothetical protein